MRRIREANLMANDEIRRENTRGNALGFLQMLESNTVRAMQDMNAVDENVSVAFISRHALWNMFNTHRMSFADQMRNAERIKQMQNEIIKESPDSFFIVVSTDSTSAINLTDLANRIKDKFDRQSGGRSRSTFQAYGYNAGNDSFAIIRYQR